MTRDTTLSAGGDLSPLRTADVLAAEEALERAKAVRNEANATLKAVFDAEQALQKAKVRADDHLPRAESCAAGWAAGKVIRRAVVIVRRTAKTITTRTPGYPEEQQQWRKDKDGKWRQWPDRGSTRWLEIAE